MNTLNCIDINDEDNKSLCNENQHESNSMCTSDEEEEFLLNLSISPVKQIRKPIRNEKLIRIQNHTHELLNIPEAARNIEGIINDISIDFTGSITINVEDAYEIEFKHLDKNQINLDDSDENLNDSTTLNIPNVCSYENCSSEEDISDNADKYQVFTTLAGASYIFLEKYKSIDDMKKDLLDKNFVFRVFHDNLVMDAFEN